jgi:hypothetical protein
LNVERNFNLFKNLSANLRKNQKEIRIQSLKALTKRFIQLDSPASNEEQVIKSDILELMLTFEELDINFMTEKALIL